MMRKNRIHTIAPKDLLLFFQQLSSLITAGITLPRSLALLIKAQEKKAYQALLLSLCHELESGKAFNHALQRFPHYFDLLVCHLIRIGEQTGTLNIMLLRVCTYLEKKFIHHKQLTQALIYPIILIITALSITLMMLFYIIPHFTEIYEHFPGQLPMATRSIIKLSQLIHQIGPFTLLLFALFLIMIITRTNIRGIDWQHQVFKIPYLGLMMKKILLAQLTRNLATILAAAVPLTEALTLVSSLFKNTTFKESIYSLYAEVNSGKCFYLSLETNPFFPSLLIQMIKTGEESGTLEQMLDKFADIYETDIQQYLNTLSRFLEPLIISIVGVLIGGMVIAMYLPLFQLGTVIS